MWPRPGKQGQTVRAPLFHVVCGLSESVLCWPDLGHSNFAIWDLLRLAFTLEMGKQQVTPI